MTTSASTSSVKMSANEIGNDLHLSIPICPSLGEAKSLTDTEWFKRCDELAEQQPSNLGKGVVRGGALI
jgi:hypothetical protein